MSSFGLMAGLSKTRKFGSGGPNERKVFRTSIVNAVGIRIILAVIIPSRSPRQSQTRSPPFTRREVPHGGEYLPRNYLRKSMERTTVLKQFPPGR